MGKRPLANQGRPPAPTGIAIRDVRDQLFGSVAAAMISLITFRDELPNRLRAIRPPGVPLLSEGTAMVAG